MALPTSKNELIEYSLRELGSPVINIEYNEDQLSDRVDYAIQKFIDRHYDGQTEQFMFMPLYKEDLQAGYITLPSNVKSVIDILEPASGNSIEPFDSIQYYTMWDYVWGHGSKSGSLQYYYITMSHLSLMNFIMGNPNLFTYNAISHKLYFHNSQSYIGSSNLFGTNYDKLADDTVWAKTNCTATDLDTAIPNGDLDASTLTSDGAGVFGIKSVAGYVTDFYARGIFTTEVILMAGTYTGNVNIIFEDRNGTVVKTETVALTNQWVKHNFEAEFKTGVNDVLIRYETATAAAGAGETFHVWSPSLYANNCIVLHCYRSLDAEEVEGVWSQEWIMKYVTQLIKQQWGHNTKKYQGVQLPGGIETTGQVLFDEATEALRLLDEQFSMEYELPVDMYFG